MKAKLLLLLCLAQIAFSQKKLPVIKANSTSVDIKDGNNFKRKAWTISPEINPDIYTTSSNKITFFTDTDSIKIKISPKKDTFDFIVLLNSKDSAFTRIKYQLPYSEKLKKAEKYNYSDTRFVPNFSYQAMDNPNLVKIRQDLKLDSIAGTGNETSKILNLLHWVHNTIRHDGSSKDPTVKNAIDLIKVCKTENRGVNCRMMATVLNECYLSLGIKSRYITCMPKETKFDDCHVINMVYNTDLKKWIWIDPTFDAYVMNEKGELLGIDEVRKRLINGKTLILNPDANWNKKSSQTKEYYLETYMTKNLYRLQAPLVSEYDSETWKSGKEITYVELLPLDGIEQTPQKTEQTNTKTGVKFILYKTNNPDLFWTEPK
ncbi:MULTISPECIES: transglutaminase-like domain-containing protein [Flavobacterium]|uniref:transglutaminase-like domain-containing protein n=1 Tax=Flavobacterium TaxID=237 RepID=UPI001FCC6BFB|nr:MULTISPECIES: transglutaminase-like domain-containing protein [Flavobacterium]UOK41418.1 transglutaminase-like domain-containing protein [Flavobacterium enshiense]